MESSKKKSFRNAVITVRRVDYDTITAMPKFLYSTQGVGSEKVNKFIFPPLSDVFDAWDKNQLAVFRESTKQGRTVDIVFQKKTYLLLKIQNLQLTVTETSSSGDETTHLINEPMKPLEIGPTGTNPFSRSNLHGDLNLTFIWCNERYFIHLIPLDRIYFKLADDGTPFVNPAGFRYCLSTFVGDTKMYFKHETTGEEREDSRFQAPQYVHKQGMHSNYSVTVFTNWFLHSRKCVAQGSYLV